MFARSGVCLAFFAFGCGSSDSSSDEGEPDAESVIACQELVETWCSAATRCAVEAGVILEADDGEERLSCIAEGEATVGCSEAIGTTSLYDACLEDVAAPPCEPIVEPLRVGVTPELPASCEAVIEVPE